MGDDRPHRTYGLLTQTDPSSPFAQPLVAEEPTASVFQVGTSRWMRGAVTSYQNGITTTTLNGAPVNFTVITQEEKERVKAEREQQKQDEELGERLQKEQEQRDLKLCRKYFIVGCCGLPFLLLVNVIYFLEALKADGNFRVRKYVWLSLIIAMIETFLWILWFVLFQLLRDSTLGVLDITRSNLTIGLLV